MAAGWPPCLCVLAATVVLIKEADKLTLGQIIQVKVPCLVMTLMNKEGHKWLSNVWMTQYHSLLCENQVFLEMTETLNPATFLPIEEEPPDHDCE